MDWKAVVDEFPAAIVVINARGRIVYLNKILAERSGLSYEEMITAPHNYFHEEDYPKLVDLVVRTFLEKRKNPDPALLVRAFDRWKRVSWLEARTRYAEIDGKPYCLLAYTDVSERVALQKKVEELNEYLRFLNSMLRHDILNIFTRIYPLAELLEERFDLKILQRIKDAISKGVELVNKMRELESSLELVRESYDLRKVILEVSKGYGVKVVIEGNSKVMANSGIYSVFENLISNSLKHGEASEIKVKITSNDKVEVLFTDNGKGIPEEFANKIFTKGFSTKGTGLGLYIVKKLMESYDGSIELIDPKKATFLLRFPKISEQIIGEQQSDSKDYASIG
ncbi:MAG: PAS domain-containing sensor histidine kinase [Archaeoglobaceae archaeon]